MKAHSRSIGLCAAVLTIAAAAGAGETSGTQEGLWLCQNNQASPTATLYVSELFEARAARPDVSSAFKKVLAAKYGVASEVSCSMAYKGPGIAEKLKSDYQRWFQQLRTSGAKVVETGWRYEADMQSATAVTASVASAVPAAATPKNYQCWLNSFGGNYITPGFASSKEYYALNDNWRAYITKAHPPSSAAQVGCMETDPKQAASNLAQAERTRVDWKE
jgi:hypothetical protein